MTVVVRTGLAFALLLSCGSCARSPKTQNIADFNVFWSEFRTAALAGDEDRLVALTRFPFSTKGPLDDSPVHTYDSTAFRAYLPTLLRTDTGLRAEPQPMLDLIRSTTAASADGNTARVGQFVFSKGGDGWLFAEAYVDE